MAFSVSIGIRSMKLVLVFSNDVGGKKFDLAGFLGAICGASTGEYNKFRLPKVLEARPFVELSSDQKVSLEQLGIYDHEDVIAGCENDKNCVSDSEDKWTTVCPKTTRKKQRYSEACKYKFNCQGRYTLSIQAHRRRKTRMDEEIPLKNAAISRLVIALEQRQIVGMPMEKKMLGALLVILPVISLISARNDFYIDALYPIHAILSL